MGERPVHRWHATERNKNAARVLLIDGLLVVLSFWYEEPILELILVMFQHVNNIWSAESCVFRIRASVDVTIYVVLWLTNARSFFQSRNHGKHSPLSPSATSPSLPNLSMAVSITRPRVFLDVQVGTEPAGRLVIELFIDKTPKTCEK